MEFERRKKVTTQLNIAPLIDVIFLLLIFFMLSSRFVTARGIKITLPCAATAPMHPEKEITVFIAANGQLHLNKEPVTLDNLLPKLKTALLKTEKKTVVIKADEKINLGLTVQIMDIANQAEAQGLVISTKAVENVKR